MTQERLYRVLLVIGLFLIAGMGIMHADDSNYYASLKITQTGPTGAGSVYVANANSKPGTANPNTAVTSAATTTSGGSVKLYWWVDVNPGYNVSLSGAISQGLLTGSNTSGTASLAASTTDNGTKAYTATATFVAVTVNSVTPASINLTPTDPTADYPFTVTFATSNMKTMTLDLDKSPESTDGKFTITNWGLDGTNVVATGKFNGGGSYGGANRSMTTTVSLKSKAAGSTAKTCKVTATFPAIDYIGGEATEIYTTTTDATKTGTATYTFKYAAGDDFPTTPTTVHTSGGGAFIVSGYTVTPNFSTGETTVTVNYSFDPKGAAGDTKEKLRLTSVAGTNYDVELNATAEVEATDDAKVIAADGTTLIYQGDWATALTKANANAGCTLQLLRNVDLGTLAAIQSVTNTFTLDLNGKILSGTVSSAVTPMLYMNASGKTLTIKDSKTGGKISATGTHTNALYCVFVNNGNVILNSGSIEITNTNTSQTTADRLYATGVYVNSGKTFTMNGGSITATRKARDAYGVYVAAKATSRGKATINNGTITANGNTYAYGIRGYGDIIVNGGTINANAVTGGCAYGVHVRAAANAPAASGYAGSLTMSGGTINASAKTTYTYGIYMQTSTVGTADVVTPEGTHSNQETGVLKITGGTINSIAGTTPAYGIYTDGDYSSKSARHITQTIKGAKIYVEGTTAVYGIYAVAGAQTNSACNHADVTLTDNDVEVYANTKNAAYAVYVGVANRTIYNTTANYTGEYASAAKVTINSGTYKARTTTTNAYAVCSATRTRTTFAPDYSLGGNAEAYPTLIIKGGDFIANSGTTTARAVSSGGNTTITGGTFTANAGTTTAYGIYSVAGNLNVTGVEVNAEANSTAAGIYIDCAVSSITGFSYYTNATLKNLTVTATTRTGNEADAVWINNYKRNLTEATLESDKTSNKWSDANYELYKAIYQYGDYAVGAKCSINGGTYTANSAGTTAYGIRLNGPAISADANEDGTVAYAYGQLDIANAEIKAQTNGTTTAYGVWTGGPTTINKCNITAQTKTTTSTGLFIEAGKTTLTNSTINATGTGTVRGIYVNARLAAVNGTQNVATEFSGVAGFECVGELESTNNTVTAHTTSAATAYGVFINAVKGNTASGPFAGDHAIAGSAVINSGTYTATATGTTAYGIGMAAQQTQNSIIARPSCHVVNGKFWGEADGGTDGPVDANGQMNYFVLSGGYYNKSTNLARYAEEGKNVNDVLSGSTEYNEGYRYTISSAISGAVVCRVYQGGTEKGAYKTLKEALQFVNANQTTAYNIVMVANHTLPKGNYVLPAKATLIVPESLTRTSGMGTRPIRDEGVSTPKPVQFLMLTLDKGVNMTVYGGIETSAHQNSAGGGQPITGAPHGNYGRLHLVAGSNITLESGSNLNCWGYTTGKGEIMAMSGSTVREGFQLGYWRGGSATYDMLSNKASWKAFPVTDYFIQNVEAPILFRPGSTLYGYSGVHTSFGDYTADDIKLVGTSGAMFLMDNADASADTWVKKEYDPATDRAVWTVNSGAKLGQFSFELAGYGINSADYYLPVSNNMTININEGEFIVTQDALLIPGAQIIISKLGKLTVASGKRLFVMDNEDWPGFYKTDNTTFSRWYYNATYSPSWTTNPRTTLYPPTKTPLPDAEIFVHGTTEGQYYTTTHGANIHSTNADAGVVRFIANAGANTSIQHVVNTECDRRTLNFTTAQLKNENTSYPYTSTVGTVAGEAFTYMDEMWVKTRENGCLLEKTDGSGTHQLAHPSDVVAVLPNDGDQAYHSETGSRNFVFAEKKVTAAGCTWWEAEKVTSGTYAGDYMANQEQFDNYGAYYYWDASAGYWKPRYVTVTWKNYDGSALATYNNVMYNTSPKYTGASPKVPANTSLATYSWAGWKDQDGNIYDKNETLPRATGNITYTAYVPETKYEYLITFKNDAGKVIHTEMFEAGSTPVCPPEKVVKASTASQDFTFSSWSPEITTVTGSATYTANFTASPRKYTITFVDWDMEFITSVDIPYGTVASFPDGIDTPSRESTDAYSYEFNGWNPTLATVTKDVTYTAKYRQTAIKYKVIFKSDCWGQNDGDDNCVEKIHKSTDYTLDANPAVPANPSRPQTAQYTYAFKQWTPAVVPVAVGGATYTAVYTKTPRTYTITYKDKDNKTFTGTHGSGYPTTHTYSTAETLVNPTKTGYDFEGWYSAADCSSGKITKVPADVAAVYTIYANWTPRTDTKYTVKHYKQLLDGTYSATPDEVDNLKGTTATSVTPDRKTYTGFTSPGGQTKNILADGSLVIEYKYTRLSYTLKWALAGGKVTVAGTGAAVDATGSPSILLKYDADITVPTVTRTGYTFAGWDATPATKMPAVATTYTAQWTPITYNITYKDQGGADFSGVHAEGTPTTHTYATATELKNPTKVGYTFGGWFIAEDCSGTKLTTLAAAGYTADITLHAKWTINTRKLTWNWGGGTTTSTTHTAAGNVIYGTEIVYPAANTMTRANYAFSGWDKSNTTMPDENLTITAQWVEAVASVTVGSTTTYYATIAEAWAFVQEQTENTTLKLLQDVTSTASLVFTPAAAMTCTFDLNNHTLSGAVNKLININLAGSTFIIDDSSNDKNGKILADYSVNDRLYAIFLTAGTLNLKAGHIHSKNPHTYSSAAANKNSAATGLYVTKSQKFTMDGGTVESESQYNSIAIFASESGTTPITINNGLVKGHTTASTTAMGIYTYGKNLTVNDGTIIGHAWTTTAYGIYVRGGSATLNGGRIEATNDDSHGTTTCYGIYARGPITIPATSTVDVFAQARTNTAYAVDVYPGITGNTIAGGTFTANAKTGKTAAGIYSAGNITVSGGTFTATTKTTGAYGIYSVRATVTVNGDPTFNVTAGSTTAYGALAYGTIGNDGTGKYSGTIKINGGTFNVTSTKETAYGAYAALASKVVAEAEGNIAGTHYMPGIISITDGTFNVKAKTTAAYGIVVAAGKKESGEVGTTARYPKATVTGGEFKVESEGDDNATAYATNTSATASYLIVQGGKYNTKRTNASATSNIEDKYTAPTKSCNYHVLPLTGEDPYKWEVAEAYIITFKNEDGTTLQSTAVKKNATPAYTGSTPTKAANAQYTYTFNGWSPAITAVTKAATYTATYTSTVNQYTIRFIDGDGNVLTNPASADNKWDYGSTPTYTGDTPTKTEDDDFTYAFNGTWSPAIASVTADATYTAVFDATRKDLGAWLDIVDWVTNGSGDISAVVVNMNNYVPATKKAQWKVVANGKEYTKTNWNTTDHTLSIDLSGLGLNAGDKVPVAVHGVKDATDNLDSYHFYTVPMIVNNNTTLTGTGDESIVYVRKGTLTVNANATVGEIYVAPGAELLIESSKKLTVTKLLVMRTEAFTPSILTNNGTLTIADGAQMYYSRRVADNSQYFQLGLPFDVTLGNAKLSLVNDKPAKLGTHFGIKTYDAASRAQYGKQDGNWVNQTKLTKLSANTGYQMLSSSPYYYEIFFPVTYSKVTESSKPAIEVSIYSPSNGNTADQGWNYICSPFTHVYTGNASPTGLKVSELLDNNTAFYQYIPDRLYPAMPFYYQATDNGTLQFGTSLKKNMPRRAPESEIGGTATAEIEWLRLHYGLSDNNNGVTPTRTHIEGFAVEDQTNIFLHPSLFSNSYNDEYEAAKWSTTGSRPFIYTSLAYGNLAFAALPDTTELIPVTVYNPSEGEMRFALADNNFMNRLDELWLIDTATGEQTDLLYTDYTYYAFEAGTERGRFFLRPVIRSNDVATDIVNKGDADANSGLMPRKIMIDGYLYILMPDGKVYDAVGRKLK